MSCLPCQQTAIGGKFIQDRDAARNRGETQGFSQQQQGHLILQEADMLAWYNANRDAVLASISPCSPCAGTGDFHVVVLDRRGHTLYDNYELEGVDYSEAVKLHKDTIESEDKRESQGPVVKRSLSEGVSEICFTDETSGVSSGSRASGVSKCKVYVIIANEGKDSRRLRAWQLFCQFARAIRENNPSVMANTFSSCATYCSPSGCLTGRASIYTSFIHYAEDGGETGQYVVLRSFYFDDTQNGGAVEWTWNATTIATGIPYSQDYSIVYRVDCAGLFCYYREYYNPAQTASNYSPANAACCSSTEVPPTVPPPPPPGAPPPPPPLIGDVTGPV